MLNKFTPPIDPCFWECSYWLVKEPNKVKDIVFLISGPHKTAHAAWEDLWALFPPHYRQFGALTLKPVILEE